MKTLVEIHFPEQPYLGREMEVSDEKAAKMLALPSPGWKLKEADAAKSQRSKDQTSRTRQSRIRKGR